MIELTRPEKNVSTNGDLYIKTKNNCVATYVDLCGFVQYLLFRHLLKGQWGNRRLKSLQDRHGVFLECSSMYCFWFTPMNCFWSMSINCFWSIRQCIVSEERQCIVSEVRQCIVSGVHHCIVFGFEVLQ